jgi:hypothetical protein
MRKEKVRGERSGQQSLGMQDDPEPLYIFKTMRSSLN